MTDFARIGAVTAVSVERLSITLVKRIVTEEVPLESPYRATYDIDVVLSDGGQKQLHGDLVPHITPGERDALIGFMDVLWTRAEAQIL